MKNKTMKRILAFFLTLCLVIPAFSHLGTIFEAKAADTSVAGEIGDTNGDGKIDALELVRIKKSEQSANQRVALHFAKFTETLAHFITKNTYKAGSTVTFDVYVPANWDNGAWWGVTAIDSLNKVESSYYDTANIEEFDRSKAVAGKWSSMTYSLPTSGGPYYIGFGGETGATSHWAGQYLLIDNFKVTASNGSTVLMSDDFETEFENGFFSVQEKGKDLQGDGYIAVAHAYDSETVAKQKNMDLNNDGLNNEKDAALMRKYLVDEIYSFYRSDTSYISNDTAKYQVTDELDREIKGEMTTQSDKAVGIRYFLHLGTEETNPLFSVSNILSTNANAFSSSAAWEAAGGGAVGTDHWWGESLFGYYTSMDKWVIERDIQMLTDAGIDFLAIDTTDGVYTAQLALLLEVLDKYDAQGFNVPKVTFTSDVSTSVADLKTQYSHLWYSAETIGSISNMSTVHVAENVSGSMSSSAFYGNTTNHSRDYDGRKSSSDENAVLEGHNFVWEFENAIEEGADTILIENWNEWISERTTGTDSEPIVLKENADMAHSSDIQPMSGGYGDNYYMQLIQCIRDFKGSTVANHNLNTVSKTENVSIDIDGDFKQWNKVSTHYIDYTDEIGNRDAEGYLATQSNKMAAITINKMGSTTGNMSFITKEAYPAGSKVTFDILIPENIKDKWWGIGLAPSVAEADLYAWSLPGAGENSGKTLSAPVGVKTNCTITIPEGIGNQYIYFVAAVGEWPSDTNADGAVVYLDNFTITNSAGNQIEEETFEDGFGIFNTGTGVALRSELITNQNAALSMWSSSEYGTSFMTKNSYPGGSTISFEAYVPTKSSWWGVGYSTTTKGDVYGIAGINDKMGIPLAGETVNEAWKEYTVTLPAGGPYYVYIGGEVNQANWGSEPILIDNFKVSDASGSELAFENFNSGFGIFNTDAAVTSVEGPKDNVTYADTTGRNDISKMKMTLDDTYLYALVETVDDIQGFGSANCMSLFLSDKNVGHCWNNYEYVVNRDSSKASSTELIVETFKSGKWVETGRAKYRIEGNLMHMAIPLSAIGNADSFEMEFKWADNYSEDDIYSFYLNGDAAPYGRSNYVFSTVGSYAAFYVNKTGENAQSFMANGSYPGGSTISFDAYVPAGATDGLWWGIGYGPEEERNEANIYGMAGVPNTGTGIALTGETKRGDWKTYSVTLPSGGPYYVFISGVCNDGAWNSEPLLIDNFTVKNGDTLLVRETFANGFGIFTNDAIGDTVRTIVVNENEPSVDESAEIHVGKLQENYNGQGWDFITADAYPAGTRIVFDAYITSGSNPGDWWGAVATTNPNGTDIYASAAAGNGLPISTTNQWVTFDKTITENDSYFMIGGCVGNWTDRKLFVDNFKIYNANGVLIAKDDFSQGLHAGLFDITEMNGANVTVSLGTPSTTSEVVSGNNALSFTKSISEVAHIMTTSAYPAGSTITFDAYVPNGAKWWGIRANENTTNTSIYESTAYTNYQDVSYQGDWSTYTATLPESGGPYYFYFVTECADWAKQVLIDNIVVRNADGQLLVQDDFNNEALQDSMFTILNASAVELVPEKEDTVDVHFTAYDSPTINGVVGGAAYDKIDAAYKKLAEAGFTKALALREGSTSIETAQNATGSTAFADYVKWRTEQLNPAATTVLDIANKYGLSYYVKDWSFYNLGRVGANLGLIDSTLISSAADFKTVTDTVLGNSSAIDHPAYAGHYATDEPADSTTDFNALKYQATYYNKWMADNGKAGELYVNLLPAYGKQDDRDWWDKLFGNAVNKYNTDYVNSYLKKYLDVATNADSKINYISWDYYPFMVDGHDAKTLREENYLYNFNVMAQAAKKNDLDLRFTLQSTDESTYGLRDITSVADMKFQIYTGMAFGVNDFSYYKYSGANGEGIFDYETGKTNETLLAYAKKVNNDVHAIENFFADYKWDSVMAKQGTNTTTMSDRMITGAQLTNSDSIAHDHISSVTATQDTLCGIFTAVDTTATTRPYGYMFVNIADPANNASDTVTINFASGVKAVCVCMDGKQEIVRVSGSYTFTLEAGEGAFIVPIL